MARAAHRLPRHIPAHRVPSKLPSAQAIGTGAVAAGCLAMTLAPVAASAKGHNGHGGPPPPAPSGASATCTVPTTALGDAIVIQGSGYAPNEMLQEWMSTDSFTGVSFLGADAEGNLSGQLGWANSVGTYSVNVIDAQGGGPQATCSFGVS